MNYLLCSIYDNKAKIFKGINISKTKADFIRSVQVEAKNPESMFNRFPGDFELYVIGNWDEEQGITNSANERLGSVLDLCPLN